MITLKLYKTKPNKLTEYLGVYNTDLIPPSDTIIQYKGKSYIFKYFVTDEHNIAIVEEQVKKARFWH